MQKNQNSIFHNLFVLELANNHLGSVERGKKITDESIKGEIGEYIRHYRNLLLRSYTNENVFDFYSEQSLSSYDIHKKMYELLKIKKYILDHPIQQAQAEIVRPAEPASIANGGKKKKNKTKKLR